MKNSVLIFSFPDLKVALVENNLLFSQCKYKFPDSIHAHLVVIRSCIYKIVKKKIY